MTQFEYLSDLETELLKRGMEKPAVDSSIALFNDYFASLSDEERQAELMALPSIKDTADVIEKDYYKNNPNAEKNPERSAAAPVNPQTSPTEDLSALDDEDFNVALEEINPDETIDLYATPKEKAGDDQKTKYFDSISLELSKPIIKTPDMTVRPEEYGKRNAEKKPPEEENLYYTNEADAENGEENEEDYREEYIPRTPAYNAFFFGTGPLALIMYALIFILYGVGLAVICALIVASIASLVADIILGVAVPLIGIIYGVSQLFVVMPAGLFEIGLGAALGGCALMAGILLYNFSIRLMPIVMKYWTVLLKFVLYKIRQLYRFIRKECAKNK